MIPKVLRVGMRVVMVQGPHAPIYTHQLSDSPLLVGSGLRLLLRCVSCVCDLLYSLGEVQAGRRFSPYCNISYFLSPSTHTLIFTDSREHTYTRTQGLQVFSLDDAMQFAPTDLDITITPQSVAAATAKQVRLRYLHCRSALEGVNHIIER